MTFAIALAFALSPVLIFCGWLWFLWDKRSTGPIVLLLTGGALLILATIFGE